MDKKRMFSRVLLFSLVVTVIFASHGLAQEDFDDAEEEVLEGEEEILVEDRAGITPDSPLYIFDKAIDEVQLRTSSGEEKAKKALEIKEERLAEASVMVDSSKADNAKDALLLAAEASKVAQAEIAPDLENETNEKVRKAATLLTSIRNRLPGEGWEDVEAALETQLDEEEKTRIALIVSKSRLSYCDSLAKQDFALMKSDPQCDIEKAPKWLRGKVEGEFREREDNARRQIINSVSVCIIDPKKCDCSQIPVAKHSQDCEVKKALAIRCEYENDNAACAELSEGKPDEDISELLDEEGKRTILEAIRQKEQQMFERFRPPECEASATFEDCFRIMKDLYGEPIQCEGLSDEECMEFVKRNPPTEKPNLPPECSEAGVQKPVECAELMFSKYGKPPQCEGLDTRECMKLMRHERPDAMQNAMPKECQDSGAREPRQCFDVMTSKYGMPPECGGMDADACFQEMMKRGTGEGGGQGPMTEEPPECKEKGLIGKECFLHMTELYGSPQECQGMNSDECFEKIKSQPPSGGGGPPVRCVGISPEECRAKVQQEHGMPPECEGLSQQECIQMMHDKGGVPEGVPVECAGLEPGECERVMMEKYAPPECKGFDREACDELMRERNENFNRGEFEGEHRSVVEVCEGLPREECEKRMMNRFAPPECEGLSPEECGRLMSERRGADSGGRPEFRQPPEQREFPSPEGFPSGCEGLSPEECGRLMNERGAPEQRLPRGEMPEGARQFQGGIPEERRDFPEHSSLPPESYRQMPQAPPAELAQQLPREAMEQRREFDSAFKEPIPQEPSREFSEPQPAQTQPEPEPVPEQPHEGESSGESTGGEILNGITGSIVKIAEWLKK